MKIQARAEITSYSLDGKDVNMEGNRTRTIELEFSAVDTGGAFRDIILDFSFRITGRELENDREFGQPCKLSVTMRNPDIPEKTAGFSARCTPVEAGREEWQVNGRLKDEQVNRQLVGFMLHLLQ